MHKIAVLTSHPIQYQTPLFKKIAECENIALTVYFAWDNRGQHDAEFGKKVLWDIPMTDGYSHAFLKNYSLKPSSGFFGQINPGIIAAIKSNKYNAIILFSWNSLTSWLAFFTCFITKTPILLRGENPLNQELLKFNWKIKIKKLILRWLFRRVSGFLYIGEENKKFYKFYGVPDEKLFFAPYAVDNGRFVKAAVELRTSNFELRTKMEIPKDAVVVLFAGKLIPKKRPMDLLKSYELLITNYLVTPQQTALLFVGDGELRPKLEKYALEKKIPNVKFLGFKNQTEIPEFYAISDILVLPSGAGETWGLAVNEAMCFGIVPVVSDVVGCGPDLVRHNENGYIFKLGSTEELTKYLADLVQDRARWLQFSKHSLEIISGYSYKQDIEALLAALKNLFDI